MFAIPLFRTDDDSKMTPIERTAFGCEQVITAMMMQATIDDPTVHAADVEAYTTLSVATLVPAEA